MKLRLPQRLYQVEKKSKTEALTPPTPGGMEVVLFQFGAIEMKPRFRGLVAVAILLALAAHPLAHPLLKECPCVHEVATAAVRPAEPLVVPVVTGRLAAAIERASEAPALGVGGARAPPAT